MRLFRGMPVAHDGKNLVWFVFHCTNKLQSQPIGLAKIFIDYFDSSAKPTNEIVQNRHRFLIDLLLLKNVEIRTFLAKSLQFSHSWFRMAC